MSKLQTVLHAAFLFDWLRYAHFSGPSNTNRVALSFDDGPNTDYTKKCSIYSKGIKSRQYSFDSGHALQLSEQRPGQFDRIRSAIQVGGHEVGLHGKDLIPTWQDRIFGTMTEEDMAEGLESLKRLSVCSIKLFRPHYGQAGPNILHTQKLGLTTVLGTLSRMIHPAKPADAQIRKYQDTQPGDILIFHDGITVVWADTCILDILPTVLQQLLAKGYALGTVSKLLSGS